MKGFPFKRQLLILACLLLALSIAIPVATHAAGSPGEQKRANVHPAVAVAGQPTPITADCSSPQLLTTLNKGDVLNASATLTSTDSSEESEGENLQILDASTTPPTVLLNLDENAGSTTITFTATVNSDQIQACIVGIDSDETGTVTFTVTTPTPVPTPIVKHIPVNEPLSNIPGTVKKVLNNLGFQLGFACTIAVLGNEVKLVSTAKLALNDIAVLRLDFQLATNQSEVLDKEISLVESLLNFVPGFGCARAIVNLISGGGIDELSACLHDTGCRHQIATDPVLRKELCAATFFALEIISNPDLYPILLFEEQRTCG